MHPTARAFKLCTPPQVTAIQVSQDPQATKVLTDENIGATWLNETTLVLEPHQAKIGDYVVQFHDGSRRVISKLEFENQYEPLEDRPDPDHQHGFHEYLLNGSTDDVINLLHNSRRRGGSQIPRIMTTLRTNLRAEDEIRLADEHDIRPIIRFVAADGRIQRQHPQTIGTPLTDYQVETHVGILIAQMQKFTDLFHMPPSPSLHITVRIRPNPTEAEKLRGALQFPPRVRYRNHTQVIEDQTIRAALDLMAEIRSEELDEQVTAIPAELLPITSLDAVGRMICNNWLREDSPGAYVPMEPQIYYPEPGLSGHLSLWGLTPEHLFTTTSEDE